MINILFLWNRERLILSQLQTEENSGWTVKGSWLMSSVSLDCLLDLFSRYLLMADYHVVHRLLTTPVCFHWQYLRFMKDTDTAHWESSFYTKSFSIRWKVLWGLLPSLPRHVHTLAHIHAHEAGECGRPLALVKWLKWEHHGFRDTPTPQSFKPLWSILYVLQTQPGFKTNIIQERYKVVTV